MKCYKCKKDFYDKKNKEAIKRLNECLLCDSIYGEIMTDGLDMLADHNEARATEFRG